MPLAVSSTSGSKPGAILNDQLMLFFFFLLFLQSLTEWSHKASILPKPIVPLPMWNPSFKMFVIFVKPGVSKSELAKPPRRSVERI